MSLLTPITVVFATILVLDKAVLREHVDLHHAREPRFVAWGFAQM
jgi:hypothetical protein